MKVIAIDLGATSGRVMVVSLEKGKLSYQECLRFSNVIYEEKGYLYWDYAHLISHIDEGIRLAKSANDDIAGIGIDTWAVDYGLIDEQGKLIHDPKCYRDTHSLLSQEQLLKKIPFSDIYETCGIQNLHFNTIYQLYGDDRAKKGNVKFLMIPDLIAYHLTGEMKLELTNASTTSLVSQKTLDFDDRILSWIGIRKEIFPEILSPGQIYGKDKEGIPVFAVSSHDTASAILGTDGFEDFAYLSSGTWSLLGMELNHPIISKDSLSSNFTNEIGYGKSIRFLKNIMGMFIVNEVRKDYEIKTKKKIPVQDIQGLVNEAKDVHQYIDVNDVSLETPGEMIAKVNAYLEKTGQDEIQEIGKLLKCIYQSMALSYRKTLETLTRLTNITPKQLIVVGGGNQASILNQYTASACKIQVRTGPVEATVLGNALAQLIALGAIADKEQGRRIISGSIDKKVFQPEDVRDWDDKYQEYLNVITGGKHHG